MGFPALFLGGHHSLSPDKIVPSEGNLRDAQMALGIRVETREKWRLKQIGVVGARLEMRKAGLVIEKKKKRKKKKKKARSRLQRGFVPQLEIYCCEKIWRVTKVR